MQQLFLAKCLQKERENKIFRRFLLPKASRVLIYDLWIGVEKLKNNTQLRFVTGVFKGERNKFEKKSFFF